MKQALREPLVHFLGAGSALFLLMAQLGGEDSLDRSITINEADVARLASQWEQTWRRAPTQPQLDSLIRDYIKEEIYFRESMRLGLDVDDPVIRRRLRAKMEFLANAEIENMEPTEAALETLARAGVQIDRASPLLPDQTQHYRAYLKMMNIVMARGAPAPDGQRATATDWFNLMDAQAACMAQWDALFESYDFVLAPPAPVLAVPHSDKAVFRSTITINGREEPGSSGLVWLSMATFPGLPASVFPIGSGDYLGSTLPCGMQVIGPRWRDLDCIAAAVAIGHRVLDAADDEW
jgi:Asp-tRNA(Asn)/Glu-tRNA(Gln) amidotransferase A subunit family amidase